MIRFKRPTPVKNFFGSLVRKGLVLTIIALGAGGVGYAVREEVLVLPETQMEAVTGFVRGLVSAGTRADVVQPVLADEFDLLIEQLRGEHADELAGLSADSSPMELCWRGRSRILTGSNEDLTAARRLLELAVVLEPRNTLALAGLAEVYALIGVSDPSRSELLVRAQWVLRRAGSLEGHSLEQSRARAQWLLGGGNDAEALQLVREALRIQPNDGHFHFLHGIGQASDPRAIDAAIGAFGRALAIEPEMERVWLEIGRLEEGRRRYAAAAGAYREELSLSPGAAAPHRQIGLLMERVGRFEEAAEHYRRSVVLDPAQADLALRRAVIVYQIDGRPQQARGLLRRILAGEHGDLGLGERQEVQVHLVAAMREGGDYESAIRLAADLLVEEANYSPALFQLGLSQIAAGQLDEGEGTLLRLDASGFTSSERARLHFHVGRAALARGRTQDALAAFNRSVDARPDFVPAYLWQLLPKLGRGGEEAIVASSLRFFRRDPIEWSRPRDLGLLYGPLPALSEVGARISEAVPAGRRGPNVQLLLAIVKFYEGDRSAAEVLLRSVLSKDSRSEGAKLYLGLLALSRGQSKEAISWFESLLVLARNNAVYHAYLGEAFRLSERLEEALSSLERARVYGDDLAWIDTRYGVIQAKLGRPKEAVASLQRAEAAAPDSLDPRVQRYRLGL